MLLRKTAARGHGRGENAAGAEKRINLRPGQGTKVLTTSVVPPKLRAARASYGCINAASRPAVHRQLAGGFGHLSGESVSARALSLCCMSCRWPVHRLFPAACAALQSCFIINHPPAMSSAPARCAGVFLPDLYILRDVSHPECRAARGARLTAAPEGRRRHPARQRRPADADAAVPPAPTRRAGLQPVFAGCPVSLSPAGTP